MRHIGSVIAALAGAVTLGGCASAKQAVYIAPTNETVYSNVEEPFGTSRQRITYVQNRSTVPVIVYSVLLSGCTNVREHCDQPITLNVRVPPGQRTEIMRVEPRDKTGAFSYQLGYRWRPETGTAATLRSIAAQDSIDPRADRASAERAANAQRAAAAVVDRRLELADINALGGRVAFARVEPDSLVLQVGDSVTLGRIRLRMILFDSAGTRLGEASGIRWRLRPGPVTHLPPYTLRADAPGRAVIEFTLPPQALPDRPLMLEPALFTIVVQGRPTG